MAFKGPLKWNRLPVSFHKASSKSAFKMLIEKKLILESEANVQLNNSTLLL